MDYPRDNAFTFLFSTYKRTAGIAFAAILIIAIPVTLGLLGKQQDVRQRAQVADSGAICSTDADCQPGFACMGSGTSDNNVGDAFCQPIDTKSSCTTDADCPDAWSCQTVGGTDSMPGSEIKQCAPGPISAGATSCDGINFVQTPKGVMVESYAKGGNPTSQIFYMVENDDTSIRGAVISRSEPIPAIKIASDKYVSDWGFPMPSLSPDKTYTIFASINGSNTVNNSQIVPQPTGVSTTPDGIELFRKTCNTLQFRSARSSCATDSDCDSGNKCATVGMTGSVPGTEIKQCVASSNITCSSDSECSGGSSCAWTVAEIYPPTYLRKCTPNHNQSTPAIFDLNDDGRLNGVDFNILYSNFSSRQGD